MLYRSILVILAVAACDDPDTATNASSIAELQNQVAQLQADLDEASSRLEAVESTGWQEERVAGLEASVGLIEEEYATESWVELQGFASDEDLSAVTEDVATHATTLVEQGLAIDDLRSDVARNSTDIARNASDIAANIASIEDNADAISDLETSVSATAADVTRNASAIAANTARISTNASDISTNAGNISTNTTDIADNAADITTNTTDIATNTTDIATNTTDIATNAADIADVVTDVSGLSGDASDFEDRIDTLESTFDDLEVRAERHYATFSGNQSRGPSTSWATIPGRTLTFTKAQARSALYIHYHETMRVTGTSASQCRFELLIDGRPCTSPRSLYSTVYEGSSINIHRPGQVAGFCTGTSAGAIGAGSHTITVRWSNPTNRGQCYAGWNGMTGHIYVDELTY